MCLLVLVLIARLMLPMFVTAYVNRVIDQSPQYDGKVGRIEIKLWKGAYAIHDIRLVKKTGDVPVPLFAAKRLDMSVEWGALRQGKLVGQVVMTEPELNFVDAQDSADAQSGAGGPWLQMMRELFPFRINSVRIANGSVHFRAFQKEKPIDVYLAQLSATIDNLTNIRDETTPLLTIIRASALAMDQASFEYQMKLDPFSYRPTFQLAVRLLGLDVTRINDLALGYGNFDFKRGWLDLVIEMESTEGLVEGYVKPLFRNIEVVNLGEDLRQDDPLQFFWRTLVGITTGVLKNQQRDQFGTLIPFRGDLAAPRNDILATVGNVLVNAFVRAYLPRLERNAPGTTELQFSPPSTEDPISVGDKP